MLIILRYDFDWGSRGDTILSSLVWREFFIYFSISCRSEFDATLLVEIITPLLSVYMKSAQTLDLILLCQAWFTLGWKSTGWTQRWADLWNDLGFSLCAVPSVCCVVATSDDGKKSEMEVSVNGCVAVEHWRLSLIRDYLCRSSD